MTAVDQRREQARDYRLGPLPLRRRGRGRVLVVDGYATSLRIDRGRLRVRSGAGRTISEQTISRTDGLARVVVLGRAGTISLAALGWLADLGIAVICLDRDGRTLAISGQLGADEPRLRRAQALAADSTLGVKIAKTLLTHKLRGQSDVAGELSDLDGALAARAAVAAALAEIEDAETIESIRQAEAQAARAYWQAWSRTPVTFTRKDTKLVPASWRTFGSRTSPLSGGPRLAITPGCALLNFLYALAEHEATLALRAVGLDPGLAIVHRDQPARASLALDLLEAIRPDIDHFLLKLLQSRTFTRRTFYESRRGSIRILPPLSDELAETLPAWEEQLAPLAEQLAETLLAGRPTPLTQARRSAGRDRQRRKPRPQRAALPRLRATCQTCGEPLPGSHRLHCDDCFPDVRARQRIEFSSAGPNALARLRAEGVDPAHGGEAAKRRGETIRRRKNEATDWSGRASAPADVELFRRDILPSLQEVPLRRLVEASGLSLRYCALIRRGERVPHERHWLALVHAAERPDG
jgi:CRISPR-associated endonuclease Cas1